MGLFDTLLGPGFIGGFTGRTEQIRQHNLLENERKTQMETKVLTSLLQSDDPEVSKMALAGLLHSSDPRQKAKGLKGWLGETQASPYMASLERLIQTPVTQETQTTRTLPSVPIEEAARMLPQTQPTSQAPVVFGQGFRQPGTVPAGGMVSTPPPAPSGALPATSPVTGGPPAPLAARPQPPAETMTLTERKQVPRKVFLSPLEKYKAEAVAKAGADIEGDVAAWTALGMSREDAIHEVMQERLSRRGALAGQSIAGEAPDGKGGFVSTFGVFDRASQSYVHPGTNVPIEGFRPRTTTGSTSLGAAFEVLARAAYGKRGADLSQSETANVLEMQRLQKGALTPNQALSHAERLLPNATKDQQIAVADALLSGTQASVGPPAPVGATAAPGGPPAPSAPGTPAPAAPSTPAAPSGGPPGLHITLPPGVGQATNETGKPLPPQVQQAAARTRAMNDTIDRALAALAPYKTSTNLDDTMKLAEQYRMGTEGNPVNIEAAQLGDLAGLQQAASATIGGTSRSQRIYADKRQHTPRLPSGRQIMLAHGTTGFGLPALGAERVQKYSQMRQGDEGGFDSPAEIYNKLVSLRKANEDFLKDITQTAQPTSPGSQPGSTPQAYKDPKTGQWIIRQ